MAADAVDPNGLHVSSLREQVRLPVQIIRLVAADLTEHAHHAQECDAFGVALRELSEQLEVVLRLCAAPSIIENLPVQEEAAPEHSHGPPQEEAAAAALAEHRQVLRRTSPSKPNHDDVPGENAGESKTQTRLLALFDDLDVANNTGAVQICTLLAQSKMVGLDRAVEELLSSADQGENQVMQRLDWHRLVMAWERGAEPRVSWGSDSADTAHDRIDVSKTSSSASHHRPCLMLHPLSTLKATWDLIIALLLIYIAISLPYIIGFGVEATGIYSSVEGGVDVIFLMDCILNFRTGYMLPDGSEVMDWKKVARRYLKSWFWLDLVSSMPTDGPFGNLQPLKMFKGTKILKCFKILKLSRLRTVCSLDAMALIEETMGSSSASRRLNLLGLLLSTLVICHWMACCMSVSGGEFLDYYSVDALGDDPWRRYLAALYWAMTTITTVGYGDILPVTDMERLYAMVAMVIGGSFYGYVIGNISALVTTSNLHQNAVNHRMDLVSEWCDHHHFTKPLRRRILSYFRVYLNNTMSIDESDILKDLPAELKLEVGKCLVPDLVRYNPLFQEVPAGAIARLSPILRKLSFKVGDHVVDEGEVGTGMFFVVSGAATVEQNIGVAPKDNLRSPDSFGEEVLLGIEDQYNYTVVIEKEAQMVFLDEKEFAEAFETMPAIVGMIRRNFSDTLCPHALVPPKLEDSMEHKIDQILFLLQREPDKHRDHAERLHRDHAEKMRHSLAAIDQYARKALAAVEASCSHHLPSIGGKLASRLGVSSHGVADSAERSPHADVTVSSVRLQNTPPFLSAGDAAGAGGAGTRFAIPPHGPESAPGFDYPVHPDADATLATGAAAFPGLGGPTPDTLAYRVAQGQLPPAGNPFPL